MRKIVLQVIITTTSNIGVADIKEALDNQLSSFSETANLCHEVLIVQDGQLESPPSHPPLFRYSPIPREMNNPICQDYNDGLIDGKYGTSSGE